VIAPSRIRAGQLWAGRGLVGRRTRKRPTGARDNGTPVGLAGPRPSGAAVLPGCAKGGPQPGRRAGIRARVAGSFLTAKNPWEILGTSGPGTWMGKKFPPARTLAKGPGASPPDFRTSNIGRNGPLRLLARTFAARHGANQGQWKPGADFRARCSVSAERLRAHVGEVAEQRSGTIPRDCHEAGQE